MKNENKTMFGYVILGIITGIISFYIKNNVYSLVVALVILYAGYMIFKKLFKINDKFKWFLTNGGWVYLFIWFIVWITLYNLPNVV